MTDGRALILGAGGHARVIAALLVHTPWSVVGVLDRVAPKVPEEILGHPLLGDYGALAEWYAAGVRRVALAIGDNAERAAMAAQARAIGFDVLGLRHPTAIVEAGASVAADAVLCARSVVCAAAEIGANALINTGAVVEHECRVGAHVHVAPGAVLSGRVRVGEGSFVGAGAVVREGVRLGVGTMIGAGASVITDVPDGQVAVGVPARVRTDLGSPWLRAEGRR